MDAVTGEITVSNPALLVANTYTFDVTTTDATGGVTTQTVTIEFFHQKISPVAVDDEITMYMNESKTVNIILNDYDIDGTIVIASFEIISQPVNGVAIYNQTTGEIKYIPNKNFIGSEQFTYRIKDNDGLVSNVAMIQIHVIVDSDQDTDGDGVTDKQEISDGTNPNNGCDFLLAHVSMAPSAEWSNSDCDNDGLKNGTELTQGPDTDNDGIYNFLDTDDDGDGTLTADEDTNHDGNFNNDDCNNNGTPNYLDPIACTTADVDTDGDGVTDKQEISDGTNPNNGCDFVFDHVSVAHSVEWSNSDCDNDGLKNGIEITKGPDSDNDGIYNFLDPDDDGDGTLTADEDTNHDGNFNNDDCNNNGTPNYLDPIACTTADVDTDGDGVTDKQEISDGTNPNNGCDFVFDHVSVAPSAEWSNSDCDNDGLKNGTEITQGPDTDNDGIYNFLDPDDDGDGMLTADEDTNHDGNFNNDDCNNNGTPNYLDPIACTTADVDTDGDGVTDKQEISDRTNPNNPCDFVLAHVSMTPSSEWSNSDCDNDGLKNGLEITQGPDTDNDGIYNFLDPDDDGDGTLTTDEDTNHDGNFNNDDCNNNGTPNYLDPAACTTADVDTDGDGVTDKQETTDGTNPNDGCDFLSSSVSTEPSIAWKDADCDGDGVTNERELLDGTSVTDGCSFLMESVTLPYSETWLNSDCDGDRVLNGQELNDGPDTDGDGILNFLDTDDDGDMVLTIDEDIDKNGTSINDDTDHDGKPNYLDIDDDGDGILTRFELNDLNGNGIPDYLEIFVADNITVVDDSVETGVDLGIEIYPLENDSLATSDISVTITAGPQNGSITFDQATGVVSYTPDNGFAGNDSIVYQVCTGTENTHCESATIRISVTEILEIPNVFTPNNNGQNDFFVIKHLDKYGTGNHLSIFNRWGNKVWESKDYQNNWDGYANTGILVDNKPLPVGTYFYLLNYGKSKTATGFIYLKR